MITYKYLKLGDTIQLNDQYFDVKLQSWIAVPILYVNTPVDTFYEYRRPITSDDTTYASDTTSVTAKLSGLTDATTSENEFEGSARSVVRCWVDDQPVKQDKPQEWVNGLPPVGVECEFQCKHPSIASFGEWEVGQINYISDRYIIVHDDVGDRCYDKTWSLNFRPLKTEPTEAEIVKDEIRGMLSYPTSDNDKIVDLIFDWHIDRLKENSK